MTKEAEVERAVEEAVKEFGRIDYAASVSPPLPHYAALQMAPWPCRLEEAVWTILTTCPQTSNFAGIIGPLTQTWETDTEQWKRVIEVNTIGVWLCNKYELRQMMKQDSIHV